MTVRTIRQYVPAYRADNGNVIPIGSTTVSAHFAEIEAESLRSPEDETEVFVAYRDLPVWQPVELTEGTNMNKPRADHPYTDPGDGRTECDTCGKWVFECIHSCKGVPVTEAAMARFNARTT